MSCRKGPASHSVILFAVYNQQYYAGDHEQQRQRLRYSDVVSEQLERQIKAVSTQTLDYGAFDPVPDEIDIEYLTVVLLELAVEYKKE